MNIQHNTEGLRRPCSAQDMLIVTGGLQCGNCLAHNVRPLEGERCREQASDGPCPLASDGDDGLCWVHRIAAGRNP